jgi:hypothetical protein
MLGGVAFSFSSRGEPVAFDGVDSSGLGGWERARHLHHDCWVLDPTTASAVSSSSPRCPVPARKSAAGRYGVGPEFGEDELESASGAARPGEVRFARLGSAKILSDLPPAVNRWLWAGLTRVCLARLGSAAIRVARYWLTVCLPCLCCGCMSDRIGTGPSQRDKFMTNSAVLLNFLSGNRTNLSY